MNLSTHPFRVIDENDTALISGARDPADATTMAIGEEGGDAPTWPEAEAGYTTQVVGEEGGDYAITTSLAEDGNGGVVYQMR